MANEKSVSKPKKDYYQEVTNEILSLMEKGELFWQKDWDAKAGITLVGAFNGESKRPYHKENALRLALIARKHAKDGKTDPRFYTFAQAKKLGYTVLPGHHGEWVKQGYLQTKDPKTKEELPPEEQKWKRIYTTGFHASDLAQKYEYIKDADGKNVMEEATDAYGNPITKMNGEPVMRPAIKITEPIPEYVPDKSKIHTHEETMELAESMLQNSGAKIFADQADQAYYAPKKDEIHVPPKEAFEKLESYYTTALHELGHWTGHESRLNRPGIAKFDSFGSEQYAAEELRAELASVFLSIDTGLPLNMQNNAAYIQGWSKKLKSDKMEFFKAVNDAYKIKDYVEGLVRNKLKQKTTENVNEEEKGKATEQPTAEKPDAKEVQEPTKEAETPKPMKLYKYLLERRPLDVGTVPKDGLDHCDAADKGAVYGAVYYNRPLSDEEMKQYEIRQDPYYESEQFHRITIYQTDASWKFQSLSDALLEEKAEGKPIDFAKYDKKYVYEVPAFRDGKPLDTNTIMEETFAKFNAPDRPVGRTMRSVSMGDIMRWNEKNYWVDAQGFKELLILPIRDMQIVKPASSAALEKVEQEQKAAVGEEKFNNYQKRFFKAFYEGAKLGGEGFEPTVADQYEMHLYDHATDYGLSSIRPCDQKAWEKADMKFLATVAEESRQDTNQLQNAVETVQQYSPSVAVSDSNSYAMDLMKEVMKSQPYLDMKEQLRAEQAEETAVASKGVAR